MPAVPFEEPRPPQVPQTPPLHAEKQIIICTAATAETPQPRSRI